MENLNILTVGFNMNKKNTLDVGLNSELLALFSSEEEFMSLIDMEALREVIFPLANAIITKAKEVEGNE